MSEFVAKRIRFQNGERHSVLLRPHGLPVHEVTLFLGRRRKKGRAANTIHGVCGTLALLYRVLDGSGIDLIGRLSQGEFLDTQDLERLASTAQFHAHDLAEEVRGEQSKVIDFARVRMRRSRKVRERRAVDVATQATRMRYMADYLAFVSDYVGASLPTAKRKELQLHTEQALSAFRAQIPEVSKRAKLDARVGLSEEEQARLLKVVDPTSPTNPWKSPFVRCRNWVIVVLLLASGMRRGELLGLQIGDLVTNQPKLRIYRRADAQEDKRLNQPNSKTHDREIEFRPSIMKRLSQHINVDRNAIRRARTIPQVFVSDEGDALSLASIDKIFMQLREACPGLPVELTSHVMRHTWNERFSEQADKIGLTEVAEQHARNSQQGWNDDSKTSATYTRRHTRRKGQEISLKLQERLDDTLQDSH